MGKVVDLKAGSERLRHKQADARTERMKDALRSAREGSPAQEESTKKLLGMFKRKPASSASFPASTGPSGKPPARPRRQR